MCGTFGGTGVMLKTWRDRRMRYGCCTTTFNQITIYILTNMFADSVGFFFFLSASECRRISSAERGDEEAA